MEQLELCVDYLWKSERYELIADINKPVIAVFEKRRDFKVSVRPLGEFFFFFSEKSLLYKIFNTLRLFMCIFAEAVRTVLRHPPLISKGERGCQLREASVWPILPCGFLWTGKSHEDTCKKDKNTQLQFLSTVHDSNLEKEQCSLILLCGNDKFSNV